MLSRFEQDRQAEAREAQLAAQTERLQRWLAENHPEIKFGIALLNEIKEYMQESFFTAGNEDFAYALSQIDTRYIRQHIPTPKEAADALIEEICDLLRSPDGTGRGGKYSNFNIDVVRKQMQFWDLPQLTARRDEILRAQNLSKKPVGELKQMVREAHTDRSKYPNYPMLPTQIWDGSKHVPLNAAAFRAMGSWEVRRYTRLYGQQQVNDRIQEG